MVDVLMHRLCNEVDGVLTRAMADAGVHTLPEWHRDAWRDGGLLVLRVKLASGRTNAPARAFELVAEALAEIEDKVPTEVEHNRARALAERDVRTEASSFWSRAYNLGRHEVIAGDLLLAGYLAPRIRAVTVPDVQAAATLLRHARRVELVEPTAATTDAGTTKLPTPFSSPAAPPTRDPWTQLAEVARHAADAPRVVQPQRHPRVESRDIAGLSVKTCRLSQPDACHVSTCMSETYSPTISGSVLPQYGATADALTDIQRRWRDYASYHGVYFSPAFTEQDLGINCRLARDRVPAAIEWHSRLLRHALERSYDDKPKRGPINIIAVGDIDADRLSKFARDIWTDWDPTAVDSAPATAPATQPSPTIRWKQNDDDSVSLKLTIEPSSVGNVDQLARETLVILLGRVPHGGQSWDYESRPRWKWYGVPRATMHAYATARPDEFSQVTRGMWRRIADIRDGRVPLEQMATALNLARAEQIVSLGSLSRISWAIVSGNDTPWNVHEKLSPQGCAARLAEMLREVPISFDASSKPDLSEECTRLQQEFADPR